MSRTDRARVRPRPLAEMNRWVPVVAVLAALGWGCGQSDASPGDAPGEDDYYAVALEQGLDRALDWLGGLPSPDRYCVAIATGYEYPEWEGAVAPSAALLQRLNEGSGGTPGFDAFTDCGTVYPPTSPDGERAGLLWVEPLGPERREVSVGWIGLGDTTGWECRFQGAAGTIGGADCAQLWES